MTPELIPICKCIISTGIGDFCDTCGLLASRQEFLNAIDLGKPASAGKTYYSAGVDLINAETFLVKNTGCSANIDKWLCEQFSIEHYLLRNRYRHFHLGEFESDQTVKFDRVPKKYQKYLP